MEKYLKPLPKPDDTSKPFWEAAKQHELRIQHCISCGAHVFYPREVCSECLSPELEWVKVSGKGTVYSYAIGRVPVHPGFMEDVPYVVAIVELAEGPHLTSNIVGCDPESVQIDMPVEVVFDDVTPEITLVKFRPVETGKP